MRAADQTFSLQVHHWTAWCGGLSSEADWRGWFEGTTAPDPKLVPKVEFLPALQRRRYSRLSRMILETAHRLLELRPGTPRILVSSRYGEYGTTYDLIRGIAGGEPPSPAAFSMSVHNTGAGVATIARGLTGHSAALAAGPETLELALLDAWTLLSAGEAEDVLLIHADEPLPAVYEQDRALPPGGCALALRLGLSPAEPGGGTLRLSWSPCDGGQDGAGGPVDLVRLLLGDATQYRNEDGRLAWTGEYRAVA